MSIYKIQRSMDMILEGIDSLDVSLILEANGEFKKGFAALKDNLAGFIGVCKPFQELSEFTSGLEKSLQSISEVESNMDKISDEYSFTDHYKMQNPSEDEAEKPPEAIISSVALGYPTHVNALRDAILEIAKWLEQYPEVFSVGKNGIAFSENFRGVIANPSLKIKDFAESGDEIIASMSGNKDVEKNKSNFESIWKTEGLEEEKYDEAWDKFVAGFDTIGQGASAAHDAASNSIKGVKPPEDVQGEAKKAGGILQTIVGALFGGKKDASTIEPISEDPSLIVGASIKDEKGIFAMSFQDLQKLIASVIEFSGTSSAAGAQALAGIDSQQQESMKPSKEEESFIKKIKEISPNITDEEITQIGAVLEENGMKDGDLSKVDKEVVKQSLLKLDFSEEQVSAILGALFEDVDGEENNEEKTFNVDAFADAVAKKGGDAGKSLAKLFASNFKEEIEGEGFKFPEKQDTDIEPTIATESFVRGNSSKSLLLELDMPFMYSDQKAPKKGDKITAFMSIISDIVRGNYKGEDPFTEMADVDPKDIASWFDGIEETEEFPSISIKNIEGGMEHFAQLGTSTYPSESRGDRYTKMVGTGIIHDFGKKHSKSITKELFGYELWTNVLMIAVAIEDPGDKLYELILDSMKYRKLIDGDPKRDFSKEAKNIKEEFNSYVDKCFTEWEKDTMLGYKNAKADLNFEVDVFSSLMKTFAKWKNLIGGNSESEENKSPLDVIAGLSKVEDEFKDELIDTATEQGLMDGSGEASPPNDKEDIDDIIDMVDDELEEEEQEELRASLKPSNESRLRESFNRWSLLAGINMDN